MIVRLFLRVALTFGLVSAAAAAELTLIATGRAPSPPRQNLELAAKFYGLEVHEVDAASATSSRDLLEALRRPGTVAVAVETATLSTGTVDVETILTAIRRSDNARLPLLIVADESASEDSRVSKWLREFLPYCNTGKGEPYELTLHVANRSEITREVGGFELPLRGRLGCGLRLPLSRSTRVHLTASRAGSAPVTVFVETEVDGVPVFVSQWLSSEPGTGKNMPERLVRSFASRAQEFLFLRHAAGDRGWHSAGRYANLTVDDPWLTPEYGALDYEGLLGEMEAHDYHTTVAFVPWNFDRSDQQVVALFREHPDRYSIAMHGNNHAHREFGAYETQPLARQVFDIQQGLARMEQFRKLTEIDYDPVMIFPHAPAPAKTLRVLKRSSYWATINSDDVPMGSQEPQDPLFRLRSQTMTFENFESITRYSAEIPVSRQMIAVNAFLQNPLLFYVHQQFFQPIGAFNELADFVNRIAPETEWRGVGDIVKGSSLLRRREDGNYDLMAFSRKLRLANPEQRKLLVYASKAEDLNPPVRALTVDNRRHDFSVVPGEVRFVVELRPGQVRDVELTYVSDLDLTKIDTSRSSLNVALIRVLSDFRDITLSRSTTGRWLTELYAKVNPNLNVIVALILTGLGGGGIAIARRIRRRRGRHVSH